VYALTLGAMVKHEPWQSGLSVFAEVSADQDLTGARVLI
jgi:hypothetical protein